MISDLHSFYATKGAHFLVDGQFGSTGKGVIASYLGKRFGDLFDVATTNAGPNSGHVSYINGEKFTLKQLPTFAAATRAGFPEPYRPEVYLNAGAVVSAPIVSTEVVATGITPWVDPFAALIDDLDKVRDQELVNHNASTGSGVGAALAKKIMRNRAGVAEAAPPAGTRVGRLTLESFDRVFVETAQGHSLGINSGFYPYCTSRECSVMQAMADAQLPPSSFASCTLSVRTYPIRVGDTEASSGPPYPDQEEISWEDLGVEPEYTTVTGRKRRVFTWSDQQFQDAVTKNEPDVIFLNFCNYLPANEVDSFVIRHIIEPYVAVRGKLPLAVLCGYGPSSGDVVRHT